MSIASDLTALREKMINALNAINTALVAKGANPASHYSNVPDEIASIPTGGVTPTASLNISSDGTYNVTNYAQAVVNVEPNTGLEITTNGTKNVSGYKTAIVNVPNEGIDTSDATADEEDILQGKTAYVDGVKLTGTLVPDLDTSDATASAGDIIRNKTAYVDGEKVTGTLDITSRSGSDVTVSGQTVTVPAGNYSSQVQKSVASATQATPSISVDTSTGVITASATQSAGYVSAGTKSATQSLTTQAGQYITPSTVNQIIPAGKFLTGPQVIYGSTNLYPQNIKSGVSIFGVEGTYEGSGVDNLTASNGLTATRTGGGLLQFSLPKAGTLAGVYLEKDYMEGAQTGTVNSLLILGTDSSPVVLLTYVGSSGIFVGMSSAAGSFEQSGTSYGSTVSVRVQTDGGTGFGSGTYHVMPIWQ